LRGDAKIIPAPVALLAPISQGVDVARHAGFAAPLSGSGMKTRGVALVNQARGEAA